MEHSYIEEKNITGRYLSGKLSVEEQMRFEEHFVDCAQCLDWLDATKGLRAGLRTVAAREAARSRAYTQVGLLAWVVRLGRTGRAALIAGVVLLIALPMALLGWEWSSARRDLAREEQTSSEWQRRYEEREQAVRNLANEMQKSSAQRDQLAALLAREQEERARLADQLNEATKSEAPVPVFALGVIFFHTCRSDHNPTILEIDHPLARTRARCGYSILPRNTLDGRGPERLEQE
jgi:hypothetical protein